MRSDIATKMSISLAIGRLQRCEFDAKLRNMSPEGLVHPKVAKYNEINDF